MKMPDTWTTRKGLFGALCNAVQPLVINALGLPVMAYIIRKLGPGPYGQWTTATSLITALTVLTNLGLRGTFVRSVARDPELAPTAFAEQLALRLILSIGVGIVGVMLCLVLRYDTVVLACTAIGAVGIVMASISTCAAPLLQTQQRLATIASV